MNESTMEKSKIYTLLALTAIVSILISVGIFTLMKDNFIGPQGTQGDTGCVGPEGPIGPPGQGLRELIYDSGWITIEQGEDRVLCTLDDPNVFVYMTGKTQWGLIHQDSLGGEYYLFWNWDTWAPIWTAMGVRWYASLSLEYPERYELGVVRNDQDILWEEVRVLVWQLPLLEP